MTLGHRLLVLACVALLAVQVVRVAAVDALAATQPQSAAALWPGHPEIEFQTAMVAIAAATRQRAPVPQSAFAMVRRSAAQAPLAAEPFLVRGVEAQVDGRTGLARAALIAAERRDPRSLPARYFLAEQDLRSGNVAHGLAELGTLAALTPSGLKTVAPFVAAFARDRRNWPAIHALLLRNRWLAELTLVELSNDSSNAPTIIALATPATSGPDSPWVEPLLRHLTEAGDYSQARQLWQRLAKAAPAPGQLLFDPEFRNAGPPPPFNWALAASTVGLAERRPGGQLHAIFYGQQDGALARQLLLLPPGTYRMTMRVSGDPVRLRALAWSVTCDKASAPLAAITLAAVAEQAWTFSVPGSCRAQWLELAGRSADIPQQADVTISGLRLERVGAGA